MSRSTRSWWRAGAVVVSLAMVTTACGKSNDKNASGSSTTSGSKASDVTLLCGQGKAAPNTYSLAFVGPKTGAAANLGINILQGAQLAIEQENAKQSNYKFRLEICDTQGDKNQAPGQLALYKNDQTVLGLVGPAFSGETNASIPDLQAAGLVMISSSATNADLPNVVPNETVFHRVLPDDSAQAAGIAKFLKAKYSGKSVYYIDDKSDYGKPLADAVATQAKANGNDDKGHSEIEPTDDLYTSAVNDAKRANADLLFYGGYYGEAGKLKKQLSDAGVKSIFLSGDGSLDTGFINAAGAGANGAIISCPCNLATDSATGALGTFTKQYKARFKSSKQSAPGTYSSEAYDAASILMKGIEAGNTTRAKLLDYVENLSSYDGISKHIEFQANGNLKATTVYFFEVKNGKFAPLADTDHL